MKNIFLLSCFALALLILSPFRVAAQKDKDIIKSAQKMLARKQCDSAFYKVLTVKKVKSGKVQDVIKKSYPCLITKNTRKATSITIADKENDKSRVEKLEQIIVVLNGSLDADNMLNQNVKPDIYKQLSRKKVIDKNIASYTKSLDAARDNMIKQARLKKINDSLAVVDSIRQVHKADSIKMAENARLAHINDSIAASVEKKYSEPVKPVKEAVTSTPKSTGKKRFYIIAGSYKNEEDAKRAVAKLKTQGFSNAETVNINQYGNLRYCFNSYDTKAAAEKDLPGLREKYVHDAWILEY